MTWTTGDSNGDSPAVDRFVADAAGVAEGVQVGNVGAEWEPAAISAAEETAANRGEDLTASTDSEDPAGDTAGAGDRSSASDTTGIVDAASAGDATGAGDAAGAGDTADGEPTPDSTKPRRRIFRLFPKPVWHVGRLLILALLLEYFVVPQLAGPRKVVHLITEVNPFLLLLGVALEAASLLSYAQLSRTVLPGGRSISVFTMLRIQITTLFGQSLRAGRQRHRHSDRLPTPHPVRRRPQRCRVRLGCTIDRLRDGAQRGALDRLIVSIPVWGFSALYLLAAAVGLLLLLSSAGWWRRSREVAAASGTNWSI